MASESIAHEAGGSGGIIRARGIIVKYFSIIYLIDGYHIAAEPWRQSKEKVKKLLIESHKMIGQSGPIAAV